MSLESVKMSDTITNISAEIEIEFSILSNRVACISSYKKQMQENFNRHVTTVQIIINSFTKLFITSLKAR